MKRSRKLEICIAFSLIIASAGIALTASAQTGIGQSYDMPLLTGRIWQQMTPDAKVAFVWGIGHVAEVEQELMAKYPQLEVQNFSAKLIEGMAGIPMNDVVRTVDTFYQMNPDRLDAPVMEVIWEVLVKPNLREGIAGRQLN